MTAYRYYRLSGLQSSAGGALQLAALELGAADARVDTGATITSNIAPSTGTLAAISDGNTATSATWTDARYLRLTWDFGTATDVRQLRVAGTAEATSLAVVDVYASTDGVTWVMLGTFNRIIYPGDATYSGWFSSGWEGKLALHLKFDGSDGSTAFVDSSPSPKTITPQGNAQISTAQSKYGGASGRFDGSGDYLNIAPGIPNLDGPFTFETWIWLVSGADTPNILSTFKREYTGIPGWMVFVPSAPWHGMGVVWYSGQYGSWENAKGATTALPTGQWVHLAIERDAYGQWAFYYDGVAQPLSTYGGWSDTTQFLTNTGNPISIGNSDYQPPNCYLDDLALYVGASKYDANFTPVQVPPGLALGTPQLNVDRFTLVDIQGIPPADGMPTRNPAAYKPLDVCLGGSGRIIGNVYARVPPDAPVSRRVRLYRDRDGLKVRETWSDATTGAYAFEYISESEKYTVVAIDYAANYRAVIADGITPALMP